jgi:MFS transporter, PAT family, beta-lactamase induction signal transducer AmpG
MNLYLGEQRVINFLQRSAHLPALHKKFAAWFIGAVVCPFVDFFTRNAKHAILILLLISFYRISDITLAVMANTFYIDMGYSKTEIANISKIYGIAMVMIGTFIGGILVVKYSIMKPLLFGAVATATINLLFAFMATQEHSLVLFAFVIAMDNISAGIATPVFIAYLSSLTNTAYTATQYALFSSLMTIVPKLIGGFSGAMVDSIGYVGFFLYVSAIGIPAILLCSWLLFQHLDKPETQKAIAKG